MFLTRCEINPARRDARTLLASPQRLHAAVLAAFPDGHAVPTAGGRVLWRLDEGAHDVVLYLVSPTPPDLSHVVESVGRPTYGWETRDYDPLLGKITAGDRWAFRLRANPVHNAPRADSPGRGQRLAHVTVDQQTDWFLRQARRYGFSVPGTEPDMVVRSRRTIRFARGARTVTLSTAVFEGQLHIEDPDLARAALTGGIGPGKGYGCGLLTLAAPR